LPSGPDKLPRLLDWAARINPVGTRFAAYRLLFKAKAKLGLTQAKRPRFAPKNAQTEMLHLLALKQLPRHPKEEQSPKSTS
jgi:hypothetical protein